MEENCVTSIAMPKIACGLDLLDWRQVKILIEEVFEGSSIAIVVYTGLSSSSTKSNSTDSILKYILVEEIKIICLVQRMKIFDGVKLTRKVCD